MKIHNLLIIGTSHIAAQSIKDVEQNILAYQPELVALELDLPRFQALMSKEKHTLRISDLRRFGIKGFFFNWIGALVEKKLGQLVGVKPGSEMKKAIETAISLHAQIVLIDRDINITLKRLSKQLTFKEKMRFLKDLLFGIFQKKKRIPFDLRTVPEEKIIETLTHQVKQRYPTFYNVLIKERDTHLAHALHELMQKHKNTKIVAVIGAGHVTGVTHHLHQLQS